MKTQDTATDSTATVDAMCLAWGESLPTRSRRDTPQTQREIEAGYDVFGAVCPEHEGLIP